MRVYSSKNAVNADEPLIFLRLVGGGSGGGRRSRKSRHISVGEICIDPSFKSSAPWHTSKVAVEICCYFAPELPFTSPAK